jgi:hypothetical protein
MAMDLWYELRLLEMSDVNEGAHALVREAVKQSASQSPDQEDEE